MLKNQVKLGADASVAAGPKGRTAEASTDATLRAEVLSYSRSRGLFAGVSLAGASVRPDHDANERIYGRKIDAEDIIFGNKVKVPKAAQRMISYLNRRSPKNTSDPRSLREN
jgi:lipid-binding SYLF domain-containing protein